MSPDRIAKLSTTELRQVTQTLADAGNKRLKRLESADMARLHPVVRKAQYQRSLTPDRPFFSLKGANTRDKIKSKFIYYRNWLDPEQTQSGNTLRGWRKVEKEIIEQLGGEENANKILRSKTFWHNYRRLEESFGSVGIFNSKYGRFDSETIIKHMVNMRVEGKSYKEINKAAADEARAQERAEVRKARNEFKEFDKT